MIAAYILIQTEPGKAATVAGALRDVPGVSHTASLAGPYDVIARVQAGAAFQDRPVQSMSRSDPAPA